MERRFSHVYEVRYDECDLYGFLTPTSVLRLMQDVAGLDSADARQESGGTWVARRTFVQFNSTIPSRSYLEAVTFPLGFSKVTAQRGYNFNLSGHEDQHSAIVARTLWVYLNSNGRPSRIPASYPDIWLPDGPKPLLEDSGWPPVPESSPFIFTSTVRYSDLDIMGHMNNTAFVELLENASWDAFGKSGLPPGNRLGYPLAVEYDIEYFLSAVYSEELEVKSWFLPLAEVTKTLNYERLQQIERNGTPLLRARSYWRWQPLTGEYRSKFPPQFKVLWNQT